MTINLKFKGAVKFPTIYCHLKLYTTETYKMQTVEDLRYIYDSIVPNLHVTDQSRGERERCNQAFATPMRVN